MNTNKINYDLSEHGTDLINFLDQYHLINANRYFEVYDPQNNTRGHVATIRRHSEKHSFLKRLQNCLDEHFDLELIEIQQVELFGATETLVLNLTFSDSDGELDHKEIYLKYSWSH